MTTPHAFGTAVVRRALLLAGAVLSLPAASHAQRFQIEPYLGAHIPTMPQVRWLEAAPYSGGNINLTQMEFRVGASPSLGVGATYELMRMLAVQATVGVSRGTRELREEGASVSRWEGTTRTTMLGARATVPLIARGDARLTFSAGLTRLGFAGGSYDDPPAPSGSNPPRPTLAAKHAHGFTLGIAAELPVGGGWIARFGAEDVSYRLRFEGSPDWARMESRRQRDLVLSAGLAVQVPRR